MNVGNRNEEPRPDDGESPNVKAEQGDGDRSGAGRQAATDLPWKLDSNPMRLLGFDTARLFPPGQFSPLFASPTAFNMVPSVLPGNYFSGLPSTVAATAAMRMTQPVLPTASFTAFETLIPKSPAVLGLVKSAVAEMFDRQWRSATDPFGSFVTDWFSGSGLPDLRAILESLDLRIIPDNLDELGIDERDLESIAEVLHDGIPLFWVPRARIAARLIAAPTTATRRAVIGHELLAITEDCLEILDLISNSDYLYEAERLREAADLLFTHPAAAQALATATLDSLMYRIARAKDAVFTLVTSPSGRGTAGHEEETRERLQRDLGKRGSLALAPVRPIYQQFRPRGNEIPRALNKHASFHRVHPFQYSRRNAAISLMLGTSVLLYMCRWFNSELQRVQRRTEESS